MPAWMAPKLPPPARTKAVLRPEHIVDGIGDLSRHLFLNLQTFGIDLDQSGELTNANDTTAGHVSHPSLADNGCHVMLAMAFEPNATQHNHFVVAFDFLKSLLQDFDRVLSIADKKLFERARHAGGRLGQTITLRIVAAPSNKCSNCGFDIGSLGPLRR
jgi:hypothetical protein